MTNNIYQTPGSNLSTNDTHRGSPVKAILIASSVDIIGTLLFGVIFAIAYGFILAANGASAEQIGSQFANMETFSVESLIAMTAGFAISIYAGYLCAKIVNHKEYKVTSIFAVIVITFSALIGYSTTSITENIVFSTLNLICIFIGAWLHVKNKYNKLDEKQHAPL